MSNIMDTYINALLADATYALDGQTEDGLTDTLLKNKLKTRMTPTLAKYISDNFTVVTHKETSDAIGSGFDATVWKDVVGKTYVSMTGSQPAGLAADFVTDFDLTVSGAAGAQIVDMVNWWMKNTTALGVDAVQIRRIADPQIHTITLAFTAASPVKGTGILNNIGNITAVNGHSLGGHLATAFARLFGQKWPVQTHTYNSAGFNGGSDRLLNQITAILGEGISMGRFPNNDEQSNFFAENGINVTTQNLFNGQQGERIPLFNEKSGFPVNNHLMYKLTDALALGNMLESLDNTFTLEKMNTLLK